MKKIIQIDHGNPKELTGDYEHWFVQDYQLIKKYTRMKPTEIVSLKVHFEFTDENGHPHKMGARNWRIVERILDQFPRLGLSLGVKKRPL